MLFYIIYASHVYKILHFMLF